MPSYQELLKIGTQTLHAKEFRTQNSLGDDYGTYAKVMRKRSFIDRAFYMAAKQELYADLASFIEAPTPTKGPRLVTRANDYDGLMLLYVHEQRAFYVFEPAYVLEHGEYNQGGSKQARRGVWWIEIPRTAGCSLDAFLRREDTPDRIESVEHTTLRHFEDGEGS